MNPMQMQQLYVQALSRQLQAPEQPKLQPPSQPNPLDQVYHHMMQQGMSHEQAIAAINAHMQSQQQPVSHQMTQAQPMQTGDQLTNNASAQYQGQGQASSSYPDGGFTHD
jgi:hypothetical protein